MELGFVLLLRIEKYENNTNNTIILKIVLLYTDDVTLFVSGAGQDFR